MVQDSFLQWIGGEGLQVSLILIFDQDRVLIQKSFICLDDEKLLAPYCAEQSYDLIQLQLHISNILSHDLLHHDEDMH